MKVGKISTFVLSLIFIGHAAVAAPDAFVYEGVLEDSSGPINIPSTLTLRIYDPALSCLLYEEQQSVTPGNDGSFSVRVGSAVAAAQRTSNDPQLSMGTVFLSSGQIRAVGSSNCALGYAAASSESRRLVISVNSVDLSPAVEISSAPFAVSASTADKISTYDASKLLRSDGGTAVPALTDAKVAILMNVVNGTLGATPAGSGDVASKGYVDAVTANQLSTSTAFSGDVSGLASSLMVNKIKGIAIDTTGIATNKILKYNGTSWAMGDDLIGVNPGNASAASLGLMKAGAGLKDNGSGDGVISVDVTAFPAAVPVSKGGTGATTVQGAIDALSPLTGKGDLLTYDGTKNVRLPVGVTDGQVLTVDSTQASGLKWSTVSAGGGGTVTNVSGTAPISVSGGTLAPVISMTTASSSTDGFLTKTDWNMFNLKMGSSLPDGLIWVGGASGTATAVAMTGDATLLNTGVVTVKKTTNADPNMILALNASGGAKVKSLSLFNGSNNVVLNPPATGGGYSLQLPSSAPASNQMLQSDGSGALNWVTPNFLPVGSSSDNYLKWSGSSWGESRVDVTTIKGSLGMQQFPTNCKISQSLVWMPVSDAYVCADTFAATFSNADKTIYVNAAGSDSVCNGTTANSSSSAPDCAFQTLQKAVDSAPDLIRHKITIEIASNLAVTSANKALAVIDKTIAAQNITDGPFLIIKGSLGTETLNGSGFTETSGIVVASNARGVYVKNLTFSGFSDTAIRSDGGLMIIDNTVFTNNSRGIAVSSAGRVMLGGNINVTLANSGGSEGSRGIEVYQGSLSSEAALNIDLGSSQNNRGLSVEHGEISIEDISTINQNGGSQYQSAIEVGTGGILRVSSGKMLRLFMNNNMSVTAISVRNGGRLSTYGGIELNGIAGQGLVCEGNSICDSYGAFSVLSGSSSSYVQVRSGSTLSVQGNFTISAPVGAAGGAAIQVSDNSSFRFMPSMSGYTLAASGGGSGAVGIRVMNNSQFKIETGSSYNLNFSGMSTLVEASNMSSAVFAPNVTGTYSMPIRVDETSKVTTPGGYSFILPTRTCSGGMVAVGSGSAAFCIDNSDTVLANYYGALNNCSNRGLKLCSKRQYGMYCASGSNIGSAVWSESAEDVTCDASNMSAASSGVNSSYYFRCCQ